ncbi:MAG: anti-sigma factor RsbA family regulatory protein [Solirubrobacterales bacterium]
MTSGFRHEAFLYSSDVEFIAGTVPFVSAGREPGEAVLVAATRERLDLLRLALGSDGHAEGIGFLEFDELGRNPARIIPAWRQFYDAASEGGRPVRGIGEPIWAGRGSAEIEECRRHESLLNLAFADAEGFWLRCPYDRSKLDPEVIAGAGCTHPELSEAGSSAPSDSYPGVGGLPGPFDGELPAPDPAAAEIRFSEADLRAVRRFATRQGEAAGLSVERGEDLALAVNELAANAIRYGGNGLAKAWQADGELVCEVEGGGRIEDPLAGRRRPDPEQISGRGLWIANQVADLLEIRSTRTGTRARLHMRIPS